MGKEKLKTISGFECPFCQSDKPASIRKGLCTYAYCRRQWYPNEMPTIDGKVVQRNETIVFQPVAKATKPTKPKKLRTMNEISAAEAAKLFGASMNFPGGDHWANPEEDYMPIIEGFPSDICARDFLECLNLYREMVAGSDHDIFVDENMHELAEAVDKLSEEELAKLSRQQRQIVELLRANKSLQIKEIAHQLGVAVGSVKHQLANIYARLKLPGGLIDLKAKI